MALQIWLPLDGTLENKGCANVTVVNNGATVNTAGKIGSCYSFDGSDDYMSCNFIPQDNMSFCCWVKFTSIESAQMIIDCRNSSGYGYQPFYINKTYIQSGGSEGYKNFTVSIDTNRWYHYATTYSGTQVKLYLDGVLISTQATNAYSFDGSVYTLTLGRRYSGNSYPFNGQLNDVRVYDHCLSVVEVKELSQGLILHYKLSSLYDVDNIIDSSGYGHHGKVVNTVSYTDDTPKYEISLNKPSGSAINCGRGGMVTDSLTVNLWGKWSTWGNPVSCTEGGGWNFEGNPVSFASYISGVGYESSSYPKASVQPTANEWHMLTGVYDRINQKRAIYIDGKLADEKTMTVSNPIGYNGSNVIWLGAEASGNATSFTNANYVGKLSDFRIYCTALSAEDILDLYHTSAKIDKTGKVHTFELVEDTGTKVTKTGIVEGTRFFQNGYVFKEDGSIVNFKPGEGVKNSCSSNIKVEFTDVADFSSPIAITIDFDFTWTDFAFQSEPAGSVLLQAQGTNRLRSDGTWKWQGRNCITANVSALLRNAVNSATSGSQHITVTDTITAEWFETYDASNFSFRCDYSDGNGTLTVTNFKVTLGKDITKFNSQYISANEFIEK